jgi:hypothetical protein
MKRKVVKGLVVTSFLFSAAFVSLAFTPHITCGCGQYEDSSQLTHFINKVSEKVIGKPIIEKNPNPLK